MTEPDDRAWENRRLILASLTPRTTTRPARAGRNSTTDTEEANPDDSDTTPKKPALLTRGLRATGRGATAAGRQFNKRIPPNRRIHTAILTAAALVVLLVAVAGINYLTSDVNPQTQTAAPAPPPPTPPSLAPLNRNTVLTGVTGADKCPRDANYSAIARAFDDNSSTAWVCTRVNNKDGQTIQVEFGRQVTLDQIRAIGGFNATAPDGTDLWSQHRIVTKFEIYFPKELNRPPVTLTTNGARDWRPANIDPPATLSKLLIRVAETSDPPQPTTPPNQSAEPPPDDVTTVAISEIQFIGTDTNSPRPT